MTGVKTRVRLRRHTPMKMHRFVTLGCCGLIVSLLVVSGCAHLGTGAARNGIVLFADHGKNRPVTPEEIDALSGVNLPYCVQVGDVLDVAFKIRAARSGEAPWDYRIEVGDSMEIRFLPSTLELGQYRLETSDVVNITFLDNWQLNVTRTVRPDGMITAPEVGDVRARGLTTLQLCEGLKSVYMKSGLIEGEPRITVNVDFVNLDRYEDMSRDVVVRPDGAIRLPGIESDMRIAGLSVAGATELIQNEAAKTLMNKPKVSIIIFPAVDTTVLGDMSKPAEVTPDGHISIARIGRQQAAGLTLDELRGALAKAAANLMNNPIEPSLSLIKSTGGRVYVGGEVKTPGAYSLEGAPTTLQAVIAANGVTANARFNNVIVMRRNPNGKPYVFKTNLRIALQGHTENDFTLRPFDIVYVPQKLISRWDQFVEQYIERAVPFDNTLGINAQYYLNDQQLNSKNKNFNIGTGTTGLASYLTK